VPKYTGEKFNIKEYIMKKNLFLVCEDCDCEFTRTVHIDPDMIDPMGNIVGVLCPECESENIYIEGEDITGLYDRV
jgi:hypothetical protein